MKNNIDNPVELFLFNNKNIIFSIKTLSKKLGLKKKTIYYFYKISNNIIKNKSYEVGSGKSNINIFSHI